MTDTALTITAQPTPPAAAKPEEPVRITAKIRAAIDAMVWHALPRKDAAAKAGISEHGLYKALRKPPVRALYLSELEVLRTSERARNIHRLIAIRDKADNMPAVQAIDRLERLEEQGSISRAAQQLPGFVIVVQSQSPHMPHMREIEAKPLKDNDVGHHDGARSDE